MSKFWITKNPLTIAHEKHQNGGFTCFEALLNLKMGRCTLVNLENKFYYVTLISFDLGTFSQSSRVRLVDFNLS